MKRYIDADKLLTDANIHTLPASCYGAWGRTVVFTDDIENAPTCDVVPRSEVEHWKEEANHYQNLWCQTYNELAEAKQEVARMVFEELETSLFYKFINGETHFAIREADYNHYKKKYVGEVTKDA